MAFYDDEKSDYGGRPIHLFHFEGPTSSYEYHYTSYHDTVTFGGDDYTPLGGLTHDPIKIRQVKDSQGVQISMPVSTQVAQDYGFGTPPDSLYLTIYRLHGPTGFSMQWWEGKVVGFTANGLEAQCLTVSVIDEAMSATFPNLWFSKQCQHMLYDDRCGVDKTASANRVNTTVSTVDDVDVTVASIGSFSDQDCRGGYLERQSDGAVRLILDQQGADLVLAQPFRDLDATDAVYVYRGCRHVPEACRDDFSNMERYGGFPNIPGRNPFKNRWGLKGV